MNDNKGTKFCFTDFAEYNLNKGYNAIFEENKDIIRGIAWGIEKCPTTGKRHNQGYIQLYNQSRWTAIQKLFNSKCHFEVMKGSILQNEEYCKKEGNFTKLGHFCWRGHQTVWHQVKDDIKNGMKEAQVFDHYPEYYFKYNRAISSAIKLCRQRCDPYEYEDKYREVETIALIGKAGSGKTSYVYNKHGLKNVFTIDSKMAKTDFWGTYCGQDVLLIDDFNGFIKYQYMLRILDRYPLELNIKNSHFFAAWTKVYITSNVNPGMWYRSIGDNFKRRVKVCLEVAEGNTRDLSNPWNRCQIDEYGSENDSDLDMGIINFD